MASSRTHDLDDERATGEVLTGPEPLGSGDAPELEPEFQPPFSPVEEPSRGGVADMLRKAMVTSLGAVFMTEEGIRTLVKDMKLPKDVMGFLLGQAERSKGELYRIVGEELRRFLQSPALRKELSKLLSDVTVEVHAEIRLRPDGPEVRSASARAKPRSKRGSKK